MNPFTKRPVALAVCAVVIAGSTLFGVHRSLGPVVKKTEDCFYDGVYSEEDGYYTKSIYSQLDIRTDAAMGLITTCGEYEDEINALRSAREGLLDEMEVRDISGMYEANKALSEAGNALIVTISGTELIEDEDIKAYVSDFTGAQELISNSGYNAEVRELINDTLEVFPANILSRLVGIEEPELFE